MNMVNKLSKTLLTLVCVGMKIFGIRCLKVLHKGCRNEARHETSVQDDGHPWNSAAKQVKLKTGSDVLTLRASTSLFARLLVIAHSSRDDVDLEKVIGCHEFSTLNHTLMEPNGSLRPTKDKSHVIKPLEDLAQQGDLDTEQSNEEAGQQTCLVVDAMAVVQEQVAVQKITSCKELGDAYVKAIYSKGLGYDQVCVVFDNYTFKSSLKERCKGKTTPARVYKVEDSTCIKGSTKFLASNATKAMLILYLADKLIRKSSVPLVTVTHRSIRTNQEIPVSTGVSSYEEADTVMMLHAVEVARRGFVVHIYSQDTDVLLLALRRVPQLGPKAALIMGTAELRRQVMLQPIYNRLGEDKAAALIKWHALTGCDTTGHIQGKGKKGNFKAFMEANSDTVSAIAGLGIGDEPSEEVLKGYKSFLCSLFCTKGVGMKQDTKQLFKTPAVMATLR